MDLHAVVAEGKNETLATFLSRKIADVISANKDGKSLLHTACAHGQSEIIELLIKHNAPLDVKDNNGDTPLLVAIKTAHFELAKRLLKKGAHPGLANNHGITPLHCAATNGIADLVQLLIKLGADVNAMSNNGNCPIHLATAKNQIGALLRFLEGGADINVTNSSGLNPLQIASVSGKDDCLFVLLAYGAQFDAILDSDGNTALDLAIKAKLTHVKDIFNAVQVQRVAAVEAVDSGEVISDILKQLDSIERRAVKTNHIHEHYQRIMFEKMKETTAKVNAEIEEWKKINPEIENLINRDASTSQVQTSGEAEFLVPTGVPPKKRMKPTERIASD